MTRLLSQILSTEQDLYARIQIGHGAGDAAHCADRAARAFLDTARRLADIVDIGAGQGGQNAGQVAHRAAHQQPTRAQQRQRANRVP